MEKVIPSHLVSPLTIQLNGLVMALEPIMNKTDEELLDYLEQFEQFDFLRDMRKNKKFDDYIQDIEIQELVSGQKNSFKKIVEEMREVLIVLEKD